MRKPTSQDAQEINKAVQDAWSRGWQIDDVTAKRVAQWLDPGTGPMREFAQHGAIGADLPTMLAALAEHAAGPERIWIAALEEYCQHRQRKGSVPHWGDES